MKSILLTFLMFAVFFGLMQTEFFLAMNETWFHYMSYVIFAVIMIIGIAVIGLPKGNEWWKIVRNIFSFGKDDDHEDKV